MSSQDHRTADQLDALKRYHAEIVECDGAECEAMRLTRWAIEEITRLRRGEFICNKCGIRKDADASGVSHEF